MNPSCDKCGAETRQGISKSEANQGRAFWQCPNQQCAPKNFRGWCDQPQKPAGQFGGFKRQASPQREFGQWKQQKTEFGGAGSASPSKFESRPVVAPRPEGNTEAEARRVALELLKDRLTHHEENVIQRIASLEATIAKRDEQILNLLAELGKGLKELNQ
jgi:hypothetical protein